MRRLGGVFGGAPVNSVCFCAGGGGGGGDDSSGRCSDEHLVLAAAEERVYTFDLRADGSPIMLNEAVRESAHNSEEVNQVVVCNQQGDDAEAELGGSAGSSGGGSGGGGFGSAGSASGCGGGARFLAVDDDGSAVVVCAANGELLTRLEGAHENIAMAGAFVGGGFGEALTGGLDASLALWDAESGELLHQMQVALPDPGDPAVVTAERAHHAGAGGGEMSAEDGAAASASSSQLFNPPLVHGLAVAPDGATVAAALGDSTVAILDVCEGEVTQNWRLVATHSAPVAHVHFARFDVPCATAGDTLVSAGNDGVVVLWNVAHEAEPPLLLRRIVHGAKPNWVATSAAPTGPADGSAPCGRVYVADTSSEVTVYDVPLA